MATRIARGALIGIFLGVVGGISISYGIHFFRLLNISKADRQISDVSFVENSDSESMSEAVEAFKEYETSYCDSLEDAILRFHVRANSNSEEDIALKYKVRDDILMTIGSELKGDKTREQVMAYLNDNLDYIKEIAEKSIREAGYTYKVKAYISKDYFPIRQYGELVLPAGEYEALRVDIGEARGENFWCILYPMMCYPYEAGAVVTKEDGEKLEEVLGEEDYEKLFVKYDLDKDDKVEVRFKLLEMLGF
ncbi:MAG: stage II sporulation protein R [Lachnospiraceae bacterium]|nr:stage II sporulation protein R [Lachnospiraceae bacterium]